MRCGGWKETREREGKLRCMKEEERERHERVEGKQTLETIIKVYPV